MSHIYVAQTREVAARMIGGEMMVLSARDSKLFSLNETAAAIWQAADGITPLSEIVLQRLCDEYEVDAAAALQDAEELVAGLASHGILKVSDAPIRETHMSELLREMSNTAQRLGIPLGVHLDLTYRCNERCVHCYLDHDDHGEMTTIEIKDLLEQLASAGVFFLTISGGEILMRRDFFEIAEYARTLMFSLKLKTNAVMIHAAEADRIQALFPESVQISIYSNRPEVHDAITKLPGSLMKTIAGAKLLLERGIKVIFANVVMHETFADYAGVRAMAEEMGAQFTIDPTITPMMDGNRSIMNLNIDRAQLKQVLTDTSLHGADPEEYCATPAGPLPQSDAMDMLPCSAGHTFCYVSPYGDVYPCVQFPLPTGNVRVTKFIDIWKHSPEMNEVRSITMNDLPVCSTCSHGNGSCSRCPGLAYMEGNMRGPSSQDCEKSYLRTGVVTAGMLLQSGVRPDSGLVQISLIHDSC